MPKPLSQQFIENKLLTPQQVADGLGWHIKTLYRKIRNSEISLQPVRSGVRKFYFRPKDVENYITQHQPNVRVRAKTKVKTVYVLVRQISTDAEAQEFFKNVQRDEDGTLLSND